MLKALMVKSSLIALACSVSIAAYAFADTPRQIDVPAGDLIAALESMARQADVELAFQPEQLKGLRTKGVTGLLTTQDAVRKLLEGTHLQLRTDEATGAMMIAAPTPSASPPAKTSPGRSSAETRSSPSETATAPRAFWQRFKFAEAQASSSTEEIETSESSSGSSPNQLEEVIVTAQKREESLHDVPMSIVALRGEDLDAQGIVELSDLAMSVPGLAAWDAGGYGFRQLYMRGVGNVRGSSSLVGMYVDDASIVGINSYQLDLRIYDLERVEVLRGPQGTLYGDGSMGGTVRFITRNPNLREFGGKGEVSTTFTEGGAASQTARGVINLPLIEDRLGLRVASTYQNSGGWIDQEALGRKNINDEDVINVRAKALWQPTDSLKVVGAVIVHRNDAGALDTGEESPGASYRQSFGRPTTPSGRHDYDLYNLTLNYDFGPVNFVSATGYLDHLNRFEEYGYRIPFLGPRSDVDPFDVLLGLNGGWDRNVRGLTQEVRLSSGGQSRINWTAGLFYRDAKDHEVGQGLFGPFPLATDNRINSESWTAFGQVAYSLTDRLELGAGTSYFEDRRTESDALTSMAGSRRFSSTNPRFFASYDLTDAIKAYASAAKGFRSGGFNVVGAAEGFPPYEPDSIWSYEIGAKMSLLEGRLALETALFYSDYSDIQINSVQLASDGASFVQYAANSGDAEIKGIDWDLTYLMSEQIRLGFSGEYVDTEIVKIFNAVSASHAVGDPLDEIPEDHFSVWVAYEFPWFDASRGYTRLEFNHQGKAQIVTRTVGPWFASSSDNIDMLEATVGWKGKRFAVDVFGQNLLNERGYLSANWRDQVAARARPRTFGVKVMVNFE